MTTRGFPNGVRGALALAGGLALLAGCAMQATDPAARAAGPAEPVRVVEMEVAVAPDLELSWPRLQVDASVVRYCRYATLTCDDPLTRPRTRQEYVEARIRQLVEVEAGEAIRTAGTGAREAVATVVVREIDIAAGAEAQLIGGSHDMVAEVILRDRASGAEIAASGPIGARLDGGSGSAWTGKAASFGGDDPAPALAGAWGAEAAAWIGSGA